MSDIDKQSMRESVLVAASAMRAMARSTTRAR